MAGNKMGVTREKINVGAVTLDVRLCGPEDGPLMVLLHGFPEFSYGWQKVMEPLAAAGYRVAAPDQRGYGWSEKPTGIGSYSVDQLTADIAGLITALGRRRAYVAGHDWGGVVAWALAMAKPEMVERLVILNMPHPKVMGRHIRTSGAQRRKSWYILFFQAPFLPEWWLSRGDFRNLAKTLVRTSCPGSFSRGDLAEYREAWAQPGALRSMINWYRAAMRRPARLPGDGRVHRPTLLIWGKGDRFLGSEMARPSVDLCDEGRLEFLEGATHWVVHEEPTRVVELMRGFCR